jgi:NAD(P)-dependent dehydrogenase (short-subunit alcohol dehydrogenase family)
MENGKRFNGKHVLITGAARGIGFEIARCFAAIGADLSLIDYNAENLSKAVAELKTTETNTWAYPVDVSDRASVFAAVKKADALQPIDVLINNAGIAAEMPFLNIAEDEWKKIIDINLTGSFLWPRLFVNPWLCAKKGLWLI